jgi:formylglycine-generating enzyme required for sulfatase activity
MNVMKVRILIISTLLVASVSGLFAQKLIPFKLPDTGQNSSYTTTQGEDADFIINPMSYTDNGNGTITDNNTGLMWQKLDGGEMNYSKAIIYCDTMTLGGYTDWRLPTNIELYSLNKLSSTNPAIDTAYFTKTLAEYWWTSNVSVNDTSKVWAVNAGGGTGPHPKSETISAGGTKHFHVRGVRNPYSTTFAISHFTDNGNGTITDNYTKLVWQKIQSPDTLTWENALLYASNLILAGKSDWRLPNIKELESLNDESLHNPSFNHTYFSNITSGNYWSSTTLLEQNPTKAWNLNVDYGVVSYGSKTQKSNVLCVRGGFDNSDLNISEALIPSGQYDMGDHFGFVDPQHPSDELPVHSVSVDSFYMAKTETTNQQFLAFLNSSLVQGLIEVRNNIVYAVGDTNIYCYTNQYASFYSIKYTGNSFAMADFRANHPVVGVMWYGDAAFCNWLSDLNGLEQCYNLQTWVCDFSKNGYRLPTEAEWEWAARGGHTNPYYNYEWGDDQDVTKANWPDSGDPYESTNPSSYPFTTPVGFYNGDLRQKSDYNWPSTATSYQTTSGINSFGLCDMAGNVWELINDWYGQNYYSLSPSDNPTGPASGFIMPDGKPYRGMRGGNWYNGYTTTTINDGHSRVSNRNPSYYRGPQDPNHPWYHVGFRFVRKFVDLPLGLVEPSGKDNILRCNAYPNPFNKETTLKFSIPNEGQVIISITDNMGKVVKTVVNEKMLAGNHQITIQCGDLKAGIYFCKLQIGNSMVTSKLISIK